MINHHLSISCNILYGNTRSKALVNNNATFITIAKKHMRASGIIIASIIGMKSRVIIFAIVMDVLCWVMLFEGADGKGAVG